MVFSCVICRTLTRSQTRSLILKQLLFTAKYHFIRLRNECSVNNDKRNNPESNRLSPESGNPAPASTTEELTNSLTKARVKYAVEWGSGNAQKFGAQGHYEWMARFLRGHRHVLEIGTGNGSGTLALLSAGHTIVSIDENPECLKLAQERLVKSGRIIRHENREIVESDQQGYQIKYRKPISAFPTSGALLLEGDMLNDPMLLEWLSAFRQFDAIACWLIGTYYERTFNTAISGLAIANPGDYRLRVHRALAELADRILPRGGVLHLVDRGAPPDSEIAMQQHRNYQTYLSAGTSLALSAMDYVRYNEPHADAGPAIKLTSSAPEQDTEPTETAFISILFHKT